MRENFVTGLQQGASRIFALLTCVCFKHVIDFPDSGLIGIWTIDLEDDSR